MLEPKPCQFLLRLWDVLANRDQQTSFFDIELAPENFSGPKLPRTKDLGNASRQFICAEEAFVAIDATFQINVAKYWVAMIQYEAWRYGWMSGKEVLDSVLKPEKYINRWRNEISILQGLSAIENKQRLSIDKHARHMYRLALQVRLKEGYMKDAWQWVQKAKRRSLSDILGLGALVPQGLLLAIGQNPEAQPLCDKKGSFFKKLKWFRISSASPYRWR